MESRTVMEILLNTALIGMAALLVFTMQAALWIAMKNRGMVESRALSIASISHWGVCAVAAGIVVVSLNSHPSLVSVLLAHPPLWIIPVTAIAGLFGVRECLSMKLSGAAFLSSAVFMVGVLGSGVLGFAR